MALIAFSSLTMTNASGQVAEREISMEYKADQNTTINIDSKFGKTEILNWDKSQVLITARLSAESDNRELAAETLQKLNSEIRKEGDNIFVKTIIEERITSTARRKIKFSIDYTVYAPEWINVELLSKYGTVFIEKVDGAANISVQYGNLTIRELSRGNIKPLNEVSLAYSRGTIDKASWLKTDLSYSKLSVEEARAIVSVSKYSSLTAENINSLVIDSKYDTYSVSSLNNFAGQMRYANLKLAELGQKMDITSSYTNVRIENVLPDFNSLNIQNSRGNYRLNISGDASFNIHGDANRGDISVDGMSDLNRKVVNTEKTVWGSYGDKNNPGDIKVKVTDGNVKIVIL